DEFGFRGTEIVCFHPLCSGKASSSSCYTKSHVDTTSACYLFCIIIGDPSSQLDTFKQDDMHPHKTVSSHAGHNESERGVTPTPEVHYSTPGRHKWPTPCMFLHHNITCMPRPWIEHGTLRSSV